MCIRDRYQRRVRDKLLATKKRRMTTAHRPTWTPAMGGSHEGGGRVHAPSKMVSVKDAKGDTKFKKRRRIGGEADDKDAMRRLVEAREQEAKKAKGEEAPQSAVMDESETSKALRWLEEADPDADLEEEEDSSSSSEDEEAALMAELEKIRAERAREAASKEMEKRLAHEDEANEIAVRGNPLLAGDLAIKKKWHEETVFRNQALSAKADAKPKRFVNDTIRGDFHRKFMHRFVK
eukprot:TRINITY_DN4710_c0_g1_i1.p1 TRINITY_DN4710_c0_g1~~TRINITY_DN4710_c0_g1_i1.p1  ORF type:complete len:235 (-),score=-16.93 TRINITY_DN4710_c0_g1_i1:136-840(-)